MDQSTIMIQLRSAHLGFFVARYSRSRRLRFLISLPSAVESIFIRRHPGCIDPTLVPPLSAIRDVMYVGRRKIREGNIWEQIEEALSGSESFVQLPCKNRPAFAILQSGPASHSRFVDHISDAKGMVGFDAQWKNNKQRLPLWILTAQSDSFESIPGYVLVTQDARESTITSALTKVKEILADSGIQWLASVMIDKDRAEWNSIKSIGLKPFLCEFHVMKSLFKLFKLLPTEAEKANAMKLFKKVARSTTHSEITANIAKFKFGVSHHQEFWEGMSKNWLCEEWISGWVDMDRPGQRLGIFNTNNSSESWFKQLLRTYLQGRSGHSIVTVVDLVISTIWPATDVHILQRDARIGRRAQNPSAKQQKALKDRATTKMASTSVVRERDSSYIVRGRASHRCRINPTPRCICVQFLWHGRECIRCAILKCHLETKNNAEANTWDGDASSHRRQTKTSSRPGPAPHVPSRMRRKSGPKRVERYASIREHLTDDLGDFDEPSDSVSSSAENSEDKICSISSSEDGTSESSISDEEWVPPQDSKARQTRAMETSQDMRLSRGRV